MGKNKKNKKSKKKLKSEDKKLAKHLKALAKELKASREKEDELVTAVEELTTRVEKLQSQITTIASEDKEPQSTRRGTTPRGRRKTTKTQVASTKKAASATRKSTGKRGRPKQKTSAAAAAPAPENGAEVAPHQEPTKVARETKSRTPRKSSPSKKKGPGRPRKKKQIDGDDLTAISGLGASIDKLLREAGVTTYREMAKLSPDKFREILQGAGPRYKNKDPQPWIAAAARLATTK